MAIPPTLSTDGHSGGFTLVEMSIVLIVIGLIVGAIFVGRDLIHSAQLRSVISEEEKLVSTINAFKLKFNCIPGDCANATDFFGQAADCSGATTLSSTGTCNGNGDYIICGPNEANCGTSAGENLWAAHHLSLANLISFPLATPGNNTLRSSGYPILIPGQNTFGSAFQSGIGWSMTSIQESDIATTDSIGFCGSYPANQNEITFGSVVINYTDLGRNDGPVPGAVFFSGLDAYRIDSKIDDGMPGTGFVVSPHYNGANGLIYNIGCSTTTQGAYTYNLSSFASGGLVFMTNF